VKRHIVTICLILLIFALFGFINIYVGIYYLNAIDAINLWHESRHRTTEADRTIRIQAVLDQEYKDLVEKHRDYGLVWEQDSIYFTRSKNAEQFIERIIKRASKSFEYQFGIEFVLAGIKVWEPDGQNSAELLQELREKIPLDNCDTVVGFTGRATDLTSWGELPHDDTLGNYAIISFYLPEKIKWINHIFNSYHLQSYVLVHELGHTFGALHPEEIHSFPTFPEIKNLSDIHKLDDFSKKLWQYLQKTFSVMNAATGYFTTHFDAYNKEIILENKYLPSK